MKGLLIKDFRLMLQQKQFFICLLVIAVLLNFNSDGTFIIGYLTFCCSIFVLSTISYDEFDNGFAFLLTLPATRKTYVREKYILGLIIGGGTWLLATILSFTYQFVKNPEFVLRDSLMTAFVLVPVLLLCFAVMIPLQLKFGAEKGRLAMLGVFGGIAVVCWLAVKGLDFVEIDVVQWLDSLSEIHIGIVEGGMFAVSFAALFISCGISSSIMEKKEF